MKTAFVILLLVINFSAAANTDFATVDGSWMDARRGRSIPYKIYYPAVLDGRYPVVIFSHGLGGSADGYALIGQHLASNGFVVVHIQHAGSDSSLIKDVKSRREAQRVLQRSMRNPRNMLNRFRDLPFVVSELGSLPTKHPQLENHLDLAHIGMAGHSYGAISTVVAAGQRIGARMLSFKSPQIKAGLVLSPSPPDAGVDLAAAYKDIDIPLFHMTGTKDEEALGLRNLKPADRIVPYQKLSIGNQYLLVLKGAEHITFSENRIGTRDEKSSDKRHMAAVLNGANAFFKTYLYESPEAERWLKKEFSKSLDKGDRFEFK